MPRSHDCVPGYLSDKSLQEREMPPCPVCLWEHWLYRFLPENLEKLWPCMKSEAFWEGEELQSDRSVLLLVRAQKKTIPITSLPK